MLWWAALIFCFRAADVMVETIRLILVVNNRKWLASIIAAIEVSIWAWVFADVLMQHRHFIIFLAYGIGYGVGQFVGCAAGHKLNTWLERRGKSK